IDLLAAQEQTALLESTGGELTRLREIIVGREASGMASRYDVMRIEVQLGGNRAKLEKARAKIADRAGTPAALLRFPPWRAQAGGTLAPLEVDVTAAATTAARDKVTTSPAAVAALKEEEAARADVEVAKRERVPVPTFSLGRTWTSDPFGAANYAG